MINVRILLRWSTPNLQRRILSKTFTTKNESSSSSSSSDEEKKKDLDKSKSDIALKKLNMLLNQMIQEDSVAAQQKSKLDLAKPTDKRKKSAENKEKIETKGDSAAKLLVAVKEVAKVVSGDVKQTESELLQKLLKPVTEEPTTTTNNLSEIFKDMKIDRETKPAETVSRAQQVRQILQNVKTKRQQSQSKEFQKKPVRRPSYHEDMTEGQIVEERVNLFGNESLGIFPSASEISSWPKQDLNKTWNTLQERELRLAVTHPPANYFQEMIQWTDQGKIWRFPIDNEQDLGAERRISFTEHVFLEKHIESWCPPKGPIRHFMELVLVGLSKNPYLTVEHKKEHIEWFKNYFNEKKALLHEVSAIPPDFEFIKDSPPKLES